MISAVKQRALRAERVKAGQCAYCAKPRKKFAFLCDGCQTKHNERQRHKPVFSYAVVSNGLSWEIQRLADGKDAQVMSTHGSEQEADRAVLELLQEASL